MGKKGNVYGEVTSSFAMPDTLVGNIIQNVFRGYVPRQSLHGILISIVYKSSPLSHLMCCVSPVWLATLMYRQPCVIASDEEHLMASIEVK